jgi:hypothetical protein
VACTAGACTAKCQPEFGDCNNDPADGSEKRLTKDKHNCGQCGRICVVGDCVAGNCVWKP